MVFRFPTGVSTSSAESTLPPTVFEVRSTSGDAPVTVIVSSSAPTSSLTVIVVASPTASRTSRRTNRLNPGSSAEIS